MALIYVKPTTPSRRTTVFARDESLDKKAKPLKALTKGKARQSGRRGSGRISIRHRGGGHKRAYRAVDFKRTKWDIPAKVQSIEYDPNRSANIALLAYKDGEKKYILSPIGLKKGDIIHNGPKAPIKVGNALPLENIPVGQEIHNIELVPQGGAVMVRGAGNSAMLSSFEQGYAIIKLPSSEIRRINGRCMATIGRVANEDYKSRSLGKAGRARWLGRRPSVRGVAMNPIDHPHGGGNGKTSGGRHPVSPTGQRAKGLKTRRNQKSSRFIIKRRR